MDAVLECVGTSHYMTTTFSIARAIPQASLA
jgi:hypothetical protein